MGKEKRINLGATIILLNLVPRLWKSVRLKDFIKLCETSDHDIGVSANPHVSVTFWSCPNYFCIG